MLTFFSPTVRARARQEGGSVMISMLAIVVVSISLAVLAATVEHGLTSARVDQSRTNAFQEANAGIDLALWHIDRQIFSGPNYVATTSPVGFTDSVVVSGARYDVVAQRLSGTSWKVLSTGTDLSSGRQRLAIANIDATPLFTNSFVTVDSFDLTGNQTSPVAYDSSVDPGALVQLPLPLAAHLGTNNTFSGSAATVAHFLQSWSGFDMFGKASQAAADQACAGGNCGTAPVVSAIPNKYVPELPAEPASPLPCWPGNTVTGTIQPGDYVCTSLTMQGTVVVGNGGNGTGQVRIWVDGPFSVSPGSVINQAQPTPKMQIFEPAQEDGSAYSGSICGHGSSGVEIWALLKTPGLSVPCTGNAQPKIWGAVVAQFYDGTGNHFEFHWDIAASEVSLDNKYVVEKWRECPVGATDC